MHVLPGVSAIVRTVSIDGTDSLLPNVEILDEFGSECLQGSGCALVVGGNTLCELAFGLVSCESAGDDEGGTVGRECDCTAVAGEVGLVRNAEVGLHTGQHPGCNVDQVFGFVPVLGAVCNSNGLLVVAILFRMLGGLVGKDLDVVLLSCIDVYQGLADGELVLSNGKVELSYLEGGRELFAIFPSLVGSSGDVHDICKSGFTNRVVRCGRLFGVLTASEHHCHCGNAHQEKTQFFHNAVF